MARGFSLAGLLRLRHAEQDVAAGNLSAAHGRVRENSARQSRAREALGDTPAEVSTTAGLHAVAAARASARSMLFDLEAAENLAQAELGEAQVAFNSARVRSIGLEKLEAKHTSITMAEELHAEQTALDEIATNAWQRDREGAPK